MELKLCVRRLTSSPHEYTHKLTCNDALQCSSITCYDYNFAADGYYIIPWGACIQIFLYYSSILNSKDTTQKSIKI